MRRVAAIGLLLLLPLAARADEKTPHARFHWPATAPEDDPYAVSMEWELYLDLLSSHPADALALIKQGADVHAPAGFKESTPLMGAADNPKMIKVFRAILRRGVDVNAEDEEGWTALMFAACHGNVEAVKLLTSQRGIRINDREGGCSALNMAAHEGHLAVVRFLLTTRADRSRALENARDGVEYYSLMPEYSDRRRRAQAVVRFLEARLHRRSPRATARLQPRSRQRAPARVSSSSL